jgi:2-phosphoglycerate kinase
MNRQNMIYLLGGPPRVGKSIISSQIRQKHDLSVVSTDTLAVVLQRFMSPETAPDLFVFDEFNKMPMAQRVQFITKQPTALIETVTRESQVVWKAVEAYIRREHDEGREALIEGVALLPELVSQLGDIPHRAVFIGNQGQNHHENIRKSAEENPHDWMRELSDSYIDAFAMFVNCMSATIEQQAKKYGFVYIEVDQASWVSVTENVMKSFGLRAS